MRCKLYGVFSDRPFRGRSTAVVFWEGPAHKPHLHEVAREPGVRDRSFIVPLSESAALFSSLPFSPAEELSICGWGRVAGGPLAGGRAVKTAEGRLLL